MSAATKAFTVPVNAAQTGVLAWAALSTSGILSVACWVFVGCYVLSVLCALILLTDQS